MYDWLEFLYVNLICILYVILIGLVLFILLLCLILGVTYLIILINNIKDYFNKNKK